MRARQVVSPCGWLRRLAVRVRDDERVSMTGGLCHDSVDQLDQPAGQCEELVAQGQIEQRVIDVVAAAPRVQPAGDGDAEASTQFVLDQAKEVLFRRVDSELVQSGRNVGFDRVEGIHDRSGVRRREQPRLGQHDGMCEIDADEMPPVVALHILEQRRQNRLAIGGRRKHRGSGHDQNMLPRSAFSQSAQTLERCRRPLPLFGAQCSDGIDSGGPARRNVRCQCRPRYRAGLARDRR